MPTFKEFSSYRILVYYIVRDTSIKYEENGRYQDLEGAKKVDEKVLNFLIENNIEYKTLYGIGSDTLGFIFNEIQEQFK